MYSVEMNHCNNIVSAKISLLKNKLNIRYAMNGTGKSTIAKAIDLVSKKSNFSVLKPFDGDIEPTVFCLSRKWTFRPLELSKCLLVPRSWPECWRFAFFPSSALLLLPAFCLAL